MKSKRSRNKDRRCRRRRRCTRAIGLRWKKISERTETESVVYFSASKMLLLASKLFMVPEFLSHSGHRLDIFSTNAAKRKKLSVDFFALLRFFIVVLFWKWWWRWFQDGGRMMLWWKTQITFLSEMLRTKKQKKKCEKGKKTCDKTLRAWLVLWLKITQKKTLPLNKVLKGARTQTNKRRKQMKQRLCLSKLQKAMIQIHTSFLCVCTA